MVYVEYDIYKGLQLRYPNEKLTFSWRYLKYDKKRNYKHKLYD